MRRGAPGAHVYIVISAFPGAVRLPYLHRGSSQHLVHSSEPSSSQAGQQCTRVIVIHSVLISRENTARGLRLFSLLFLLPRLAFAPSRSHARTTHYVRRPPILRRYKSSKVKWRPLFPLVHYSVRRPAKFDDFHVLMCVCRRLSGGAAGSSGAVQCSAHG